MASELPIKFVHEDAELIIKESKEYYEQLLNRQIAPADIEMFWINGLAYREMMLRAGINDTGNQNLLRFSRGAALEYLAEQQGVYRLPASGALTTIQFNLVEGHNGVEIPEGLRVQSTDGKVIFRTIEGKVCPVGTETATLKAECSTPGIIGNGYAANKINIILDPQAFISTAYNIDETKGGADEESDDNLKQRVILAPSSFSVAGPDDAYKFFAKSANPSIVDVAVKGHTPDAGDVSVYPLCEGGVMPSAEIISAVQSILSSEKVRPLNDTVYVLSPTQIDYEIEINLTLLVNAIEATTRATVEKNLSDFIASRKNRLGLDVVRSKIVSLAKIDGVYDIEVVSPVANISADKNDYPNCTGITVNITGTHDE